MADEQRILDIIDGLEENFTEQEAYRIYIEFCFRFIPRIEHKIPESSGHILRLPKGTGTQETYHLKPLRTPGCLSGNI